jgi:hypothetical protein
MQTKTERDVHRKKEIERQKYTKREREKEIETQKYTKRERDERDKEIDK